jgi:hypothetical protein
MIIALADRLRLPAVYRIPQFAQRGGLSSYANDVRGGYRPAAGYVDRILKGEKPADLPVQAPTKYELELHGGRRQLAHLHAPIRPSDVPRRPAPFIPLDHSESLSRNCQSHPA